MPPSLRLLILFSLLLASVDTPAGAQSHAQEVRVRLLGRTAPEAVVLRAQDGPTALFAAATDNPIARLQPGEAVTVGVRGEELHVEMQEGGFFAQALRAVPEAGATWSLGPAAGTPGEASTYSGTLQVAPDPAQPALLQLINTVPLEDYVASVVASEYGLGDLEGAKAVAVVARTYALQGDGKFGARYDHVDHTHSQVYGGQSAVTPLAREAVQATRGEVLTYGGQLAEAVYFSASGGHTADNEDVWDADPLPYLRGKADPYAGNSPHARWRTTVDRSRLLGRLTARYGFEVEGFVIGERSEDGRVRYVEILGPGGRQERMLANDFRLFVNAQASGLGVRSTLFDARRAGSEYVFEGRGFGHGVGLSQYGAHAMAEQGYDYRAILDFYYTGTDVEQLDGLSAPPARIVADQEQQDEESAPKPTRRVGW